ncbi:hypothetical protein MFIFM68171_03683 [Madurella fahalii]|uniref:Uncharacterized protein n=1 Tax=Madurella fahalii TaxID=1157608 RepID=A0ABQ0G6T5_9PEZI
MKAGFLLTMSPAAGVDYLNTNMPYYLQLLRDNLSNDNFASATAQIYREFSESGTTPYNIRQGYSVPSLMDAYDSIVHELWQRNETINLVRAYLVCLDELTVLQEIFSKKLDFLNRLRQDCEDLVEESQDPRESEGRQVETLASRIAFAEYIMSQSSTQCGQLIADLRESLNTLFQLRSIEQNELAIVADTQNKAIFVFTAITIVFLPLSFFTSYFGMNLDSVAETKLTEAYFWEVCGTVSIVLILIVSLYAFRHRLKRRLAAVMGDDPKASGKPGDPARQRLQEKEYVNFEDLRTEWDSTITVITAILKVATVEYDAYPAASLYPT